MKRFSLLCITIALLCITGFSFAAEKSGLEIMKERLAKMEENENKLYQILDHNLPFIIVPKEGRTLFADPNSTEIVGLTSGPYKVNKIAKDESNMIMLLISSVKSAKKYWMAFSLEDELKSDKLKKEIQNAKIDLKVF